LNTLLSAAVVAEEMVLRALQMEQEAVLVDSEHLAHFP
jgi:hypothetical protein